MKIYSNTQHALIYKVFHQPMQLGESPLWHAQENSLYWIDIINKTIHRLNETTKLHSYWLMPSEPGCIALHENGGLIVALRTGLIYLNTDTGKISNLKKAPYDTTIIRFNDGRCDSMGRLWIGTIYEPKNSKKGNLFCFEKGCLHHIPCYPVTTSNGITFDTSYNNMYHSDTKAHCIYKYKFNLITGKISNIQQFYKFSLNKLNKNYSGRPDGATIDCTNSYWCAMFEGACILQINQQKIITKKIKLPILFPTMIAFGGCDLRTIYITSKRNGCNEDHIKKYPLSGYTLAFKTETSGILENFYKE